MYLIVRILGWLVVLLYLLSVDRYFLRMGPFAKMDAVKPIRRFLVRFHKPLGIVTSIIALAHANLAFTGISPSLTGALTFVTMLIVVVIGVLMHLKKISMKNMKVHRFMSIVIIGLIVLHVMLPYLFLQ